MQNSIFDKIEISKDQIFDFTKVQKFSIDSSGIIPQIQFLISRTAELRTVLKEIDETLKRLKEESQTDLIKKTSV